MNSRSVAVALVTIAMALSSVGGPLLAGDDGMPDPASSSPLGGSRAGPMSELAVNFSVRNPLGLARAPEVAWVNLSSPPGLLSDPSDIALLRRGTTTELLADHLPGDVRRHPDGSVSSVVLHFQDRWAPMETLDYTAVLGRRPSVQGNDMYYQSSGEFVIVRDSDVEYQVHIDDSIYSQYQGLYYLYIVNSPSRQLRAHGSALTRVGGNQLDPDQASFQMWWGRHTDIEVHRSSLVTRIELSYDRPEIAHWGPGGDPAQWIRNVDFLRAEVTLTFYSGIHRIDVHSKKVVSERFWNHNGFVMEFTAILGEGADWQGGFETVFGTDARIVMETTTQGPTWTRTTTQWQDVDAGADAAPALADLDGDGDLDMVMGSEDGNLTVWENVGTAADPQMTENASWAGGLPSVEGPTPALADLDADGDADLLLGERAGYLKVYRNEGGPSGPPSWTRWWGNFDRLGLGSATAPCFGDVDDDGDLDILVGLGDGAIKGIENVGGATSPSWDLHDRWVGHLNSGPTRSPAENYAVPHLADLDGDRDLDLLIGSDDGKVTYFENVGNSWNPRWTRLDLALFAGVATGTIWEGNSTPVMADLDDDGDADLLVGTHGGTLHHYRFDGWTTPYRGHNNLQPLLNDTYRHMRDKDGNDGCFVVEGYGHDFLGYYVLANPRNGYAALRYLPDFDRLAYKHEYYGDRFPAAGGNVSYYPYDAGATEYVTRAQITSNAMTDGVSAGTFISQTGTSAGFVMQPMTAMAYESDEILVLDLVRQTDPAVYDRYADPLRAPLEVLLPANIVVEGLVTVPVAPAQGEPATLVVTLANRGSTDLEGVAVEVEALIGSAPLPGDPLVATAVDLPAGSTRRLSLGLDTWWLAGEVTLRCIADPDDAVAESSESDNNANYAYTAGHDSLTWSDPIPATTHINTSLHPDAVVRGDGQLYVVWETCQNLEDIDIEGRAYDPATGAWGPKETLVTAAHYAVEPDLVAVGDQVHLAYSSNIVALENYYRTAHAKYYWGEKFDIYTMTWSGGSWSDPTRVTRAVDFDDADQAPDIVHGAGRLRVFFRNTHFDFYTNGNQMDNIPFQEMDVREASRDPASGWTSGNVTLSVTSGSQAWWGGPRAAAEGSDLVWVVYATEVGNSQWDLVAEARGSAGLVQRVDLARTSGSDEVRPAVAAANDDPSLVVAYEKVAGGNREIAIRRRSPGPNPSQGWRQEELVFPHPASDIKPSVAQDGHGTYWIAWESTRTGNKDIFMARWNDTGLHGPYQVTTHPGSDEQPVVTCDPDTGRVYVAWETDRNGMGNKDIYIRHMLPHPPELTLDAPERGFEDSPVEVSGTVSDPDGDLNYVMWDWGDGELSRTHGELANHTYRLAGNYTVRAWAVDRFDLRSGVQRVKVTVENVPPVAVVEGDIEAEEDAEAHFTAWTSHDTPSDNSSLTVRWDFGDGTTSGPDRPLDEGANQTHVYTASGIYTVGVGVMDDDGDSSWAELNVTVINLPPTVEAWARPELLEEDEEGEFAGRAFDTPSDTARGFTFFWDWGDGTRSGNLTDPMASHSYGRSGNYTATLHVLDDDVAEGTASVDLSVGNLPPEVEVVGQTSIVEDGTISLQALGTDTSYDQEHLEYKWDWGDGTVTDWSASETATHSFAYSGVFTVTVWVRDDDGAEASFVHTVSVTNEDPIARASASPAQIPEGGWVHLSGSESWDTPSDLEDLKYSWDVGLEIITTMELDYSFKASGIKVVTLTVTDDDGESSTTTVEVLVINRPPVARGFLGPLKVRVGELVTLDASNSTDDPWDVGGLEYRWKMGDGGPDVREQRSFYIYQNPGDYFVVLTVTDGDEDTSRWNVTVTVLPEETDDDGGGLSTAAWSGIVIALVLVVLIVAILLVRGRRGNGNETGWSSEIPPSPEPVEEALDEAPATEPEDTVEGPVAEADEEETPETDGSDLDELRQRVRDLKVNDED